MALIVKQLPTVIASRSGQTALEICEFDGKERVPNRDAVAFVYGVRLAPNAAQRRLTVIFSGTVFYVKPEAFGLPDYGDHDQNFGTFALAAIGDYLDDAGLPEYANDLHVPQIEVFSPHLQAWADRDRAPDEVIETYLAAHGFWSWKFGHETWTVGPPDQLRLRSDLKNTGRLIQLGEGQDWNVLKRADDAVTLKPTSEFLRRTKQGFQAAASPATPPPQSDTGSEDPLPERPAYVYVDEVRIADLKRLEQRQYDLRKVIALCEELNLCYRSQCHHAVAALTRALLDHVPPIFSAKAFTEVANNHPGGKSFKELMQRLDGAARKITDAHLHTQIRNVESLPTRTQVNFSNEIDALLAEIVRVLS